MVALIGRFRKLEVPIYSGEEGPKKAEEFIVELENAFDEGLSVDEYEAKFSALSRYGQPISAEVKAKKFEEGPRPEIIFQLRTLMLTIYEEIYMRAQSAEEGWEDMKPAGEEANMKMMLGV
ncbi:hypothetical protein MLD38_033958 [Melastoma candidum]|uniref:Uncharacterized protein n=1 Tax=Melastoma candidum TaxID=119954 RepID=A0ACB9M900_9MYRT|nr:hypothetical protein MLD38_033958 [Melastoma candidum]